MATYAYDALNRVAQLAYSDQVINFTYDAGTNGIGRLTGASDANHALSWSYDTHGRVIGKGQTVGSVTKSVGYAYTNDDLTSLVTPSGQTITYGYINHRISSISINGKSLLSGVTYEPFGSVNGWTWGNSTIVGRTYSTDEQVTQLSTAGDVIKFGYDNALRLTSVADKEVSANSWSAGYDVLDRVTSAATTGTSYGWTYDADGNRLTQSGSNATTFNPASASNRLSSTTGSLARTYSYDGAGNTASYASDSFTFNQRGRMAVATANEASTHYVYSALGQMIEKSGASATTLFMYDEAGHLLGEYSSSGALIEETIWMGDVPVATLRPSGSSISVYYIHSDQFGSPRAVTLPSNNALAWLWSANPYGVDAPNQNPQGLGTFVYNLRFPGQYYQAETGLNYNYFRDYDPQTGRYIESDPMGLRAGVNTYAYVHENPISRSDRLGLDDSICMFNPSMCGPGPAQQPPADTGSQCDRCQGSDRWSYTPPAVCAAGDAMCGIAMQAAGIPGPYYSTTHVVSRKCVLAYLTLAKPVGYVASSLFGRGVVLSYGLQYPALGELALDLTGPAAGVVAVPYAMDEIVNKCSCGN